MGGHEPKGLAGLGAQFSDGVSVTSQSHDQPADAVLRWLHPEPTYDGHFARQEYLSKLRVPGTGNWLMSSILFKDWINIRSYPSTPFDYFLGCPGIPGAGKTILMSLVVDTLRDRYGQEYSIDDDIVVAFLYLDSVREGAARTANAILRTIITQLAMWNKFTLLFQRCQQLASQSSSPASDEMVDELLNYARWTCAKIFVVLDGLDELEDDDRMKLLQSLSGAQGWPWDKRMLNVLATSRYPGDLAKFCEKMLEIRAHPDDLNLYFNHRILNLPARLKFIQRDPSFQEKIRDSIIKRAGSVFFVATLYMQTIEGECSKQGVNRALDTDGRFPALELFYSRMLDRLERCESYTTASVVQRVMSWILVAVMPLTTAKLLHAGCIKSLSRTMNHGEKSSSPESVGWIYVVDDKGNEEAESSRHLHSWITIDHITRELAFFHDTARDYLLRARPGWVTQAELQVADACVSYLQSSSVHKGLGDLYIGRLRWLRDNKFLAYAAKFWSHHVERSFTAGSEVSKATLAFLESPDSLAAAGQVLEHRSRWCSTELEYPSGWRPTALHLASYLGAENIVRYLLGGKAALSGALDCKDNFGRTPLFWAAGNGHTHIVTLLLQQGAEIDSRDGRGRTALAFAVVHSPDICQNHAIRILCDLGADVDAPDNLGLTPLALACEKKRPSVAELLVQRGAAIEAADRNGRRPLWHAASQGEKTIVKFLLQAGASTEGKDKDGHTVLSAALDGHALKVLPLLLHAMKVDRSNWARELATASQGLDRIDKFMVSKLLEDDIRENSVSASKVLPPSLARDHPADEAEIGGDEDDDLQTEHPGGSDWSRLSPSVRAELVALVKELITKLLDDEIFGQQVSELLSDEGVERLAGALPRLVEAFALNIGHGAEAPIYWEIMWFIHKYSRKIITSFCEQLRARQDTKFREDGDSAAGLEMEFSADLDPQDRLDQWLDTSTTARVAVVEKTTYTKQDDSDSIELPDPTAISEASGEAIVYCELLSDTPAYQWLLGSLRRELVLSPADPNIMADIQDTIMSVLPKSYLVSRHRRSASFVMVFELDWDPQAFVWREQYDEECGAALGMALTLTGSANDAQALSCAQYLAQTWPTTGPRLLETVKDLSSSAKPRPWRRYQFGHGMWIKVEMQGPKLVVRASGTGRFLAELGQQLAWLGAALRSAPLIEDHSIFLCRPQIAQLVPEKQSSDPASSDVTARWALEFKLNQEPMLDGSASPQGGRCWLSLFRRPVVVHGYPIRSKPSKGTGLEIDLGVATELAQAHGTTVFDGRIVVKGFYAMLVLAERLENALIWHLLLSEDGSRISYLDRRVSDLPKTCRETDDAAQLTGLERTRHIIGWCRSAQSHTGGPEANYDIQRSRLRSSFEGNIFNVPQLPSYKWELIRSGRSVSLARKDKGKAYGDDDGTYEPQLMYFAKKSLVLYDVGNDRAWLVDGASALLHAVRASIQFDKDDPIFGTEVAFQMLEYDPRIDGLGNHRAASVLSYDRNKNMPLLRKGGQLFHHRVQQVAFALELILDFQRKFNLQQLQMGTSLPQHHLEGFEFYDLAKAENEGRIRICTKNLATKRGNPCWLHLTRKTDAPVLFGKEFGDLITPVDVEGDVSQLCHSWRSVPARMGFLTACLRDLRQLMKDKGDDTQETWRLVDDICWYQADKMFEPCPQHHNSPETQCDVVQLLIPENSMPVQNPTGGSAIHTKKFANFGELPHDGAVIFGLGREHTVYLEELNGELGSRRGSSTHWEESSRYRDFLAPSTSGLYRASGSPSSLGAPVATSRTQASRAPSHISQPELPPPRESGSQVQPDGQMAPISISQDLSKVRPPVEDTQPTVYHRKAAVVGLLAVLFFRFDGFYWKTLFLSLMITYGYWIILSSFRFGSGASWRLWLVSRALFILCLAWCIVLSPVHTIAPTPLDLWTKYEVHPPHDSSITVYQPLPGNQIDVDVFALHGLGSNPASAWRVRNETHSGVQWLIDILPKRPGYENLRITLLNHQTRWDSHVPQLDIKDYADTMLKDILRINKVASSLPAPSLTSYAPVSVANYDPQGKRPILFIAHSFGGLLLKQVLIMAHSDARPVAQMTKGILFLGVPHLGSNTVLFASLLSCTAFWRGSSTALLRLMAPGSQELQALDDEFYRLYVHPDRPSGSLLTPYIANFIEMRPEKFGTLSVGPTVNLKGGRLRYAKNIFLDTDHRGLNKFPSAEDPNFRKFLAEFDTSYQRK